MNIEDARRHRLYSRSVAALNRWVEAYCLGGRKLPYFDPLDGGVDARILILLESPARDSSWPRFVSRDNAGPAQRNLKRFLEQACLAREQTILWNLYPWLPDLGSPAQAISRSKITEGVKLLKEVLDLLPRLRVVVLAGRVAQRGAPGIEHYRPELRLLAMPHPSPLSVCQHPDVAKDIVSTLTRAAHLASV
ncbi:uracil-DNA glycosylase [Pseudomonas cremoricolorata]|uniref:uracil-DNA glycosylase n=1 Tax=Pseudomonas cremoricolorata TaxID=157783 RepID=UPI001FE13681|nr:uracil-DNA glycosylase [Pseudomonas cremoricolorata]